MKNIHNFNQFLNFYCKKHNQKIYYLAEKKKEQIDYSELLIILKKFNFFLNKKIKSKSKILVLLDNSKALLIVFLSILYGFRVFIPINPKSGDKEIDYIIKKTKPSFFITDTSFKKKIPKIYKSKTLIINHNNFLKKIKNIKNYDNNYINKKSKKTPAQILFTSGSTGNPKGVVLTHQSMLTNIIDLNQKFSIYDKYPKFLSVTPLYHNNGQFIPTLLPMILGGSTISISPETSLINFWPVAKKFKINYSSVMATHINYFNKLNKIKGHALKSLFCGGAKLDNVSQRLFEKKFRVKVLCNYGLTETSSIAATESLKNREFSYGSVGKQLKSNKIKFYNKKGKFGEIWVKGENLFKNYLGEKKLTKSKFSNGWFKTGDLGFKNKKGYIFVKDRIDNMIVVSGENIYPVEIENHLSNFKKITLGVVASIPDKITQNKLILVYEGKKLLSYNEFYNFLKKKISKFKIPKNVFNIKEFGLNEIPKAANKKILREKLKLIINKKLLKKF